MEILVENFAERLDLIVESVRTADFIAIDTEFSGKLKREKVDLKLYRLHGWVGRLGAGL